MTLPSIYSGFNRHKTKIYLISIGVAIAISLYFGLRDVQMPSIAFVPILLILGIVGAFPLIHVFDGMA